MRILNIAVAILALGFSASSFAQQKTAASCASCHSAEVQSQTRTLMGRALLIAGEPNPVLDTHSRLTFQKFGYTYVVETRNGQSTYSVSDGTRTITLPIRWSFGSGSQTWMFERDGVYYESLVSYYTSINGLEITTGDSEIIPTSLEQAVGRRLPPNEPKACFGCHTTGALRSGQLDLSSFESGVTCEHCHVGSTSHLITASQGTGDIPPPDLRKLRSEDLSNFCGQCHRSWEAVIRNPWRGEITARFQPYRLAESKCFNGADPRISCIACHDPHRDLVTDTKAYDGKCLACHAGKGTAATDKTAKTCPVATNNCASCHMPEVKMPNGLAAFHDHRIRITKAGAPYPE